MGNPVSAGSVVSDLDGTSPPQEVLSPVPPVSVGGHCAAKDAAFQMW